MSTVQTAQLKNALDQDLIAAFVRDCKLRSFSSETIVSHKSILRIVSRFLNRGDLNLTCLNRSTLKALLEYLLEHKFSHKTLENYFTALSTFSDYLVYEGVIKSNDVLPFRKRYLRQYKNGGSNSDSQRKLISVEEMSMLINSILDPRDKAIVTLFAKTGIRRNELVQIDLDEIDWLEQSIRLKPHRKRSNCTVFFDVECALVLRRWMKAREGYDVEPECETLLINERGGRLGRNGVYNVVTENAKRVGLHDPESERAEDHFFPHCCRHWFTTCLRRNGIQRELLKELRGDARNEAVDIYDHIDRKELKRAYLAAIPVLGIA